MGILLERMRRQDDGDGAWELEEGFRVGSMVDEDQEMEAERALFEIGDEEEESGVGMTEERMAEMPLAGGEGLQTEEVEGEEAEVEEGSGEV